MKAIIEVWTARNREVFCFTEDIVAHRELSRLNGKFATYTRNGRVFAWQHCVPRCTLAKLGRGIVQIRALETQDLEESDNRISTEQGDLFGDGPLVGSEEKPSQDEAA
jgi:hypothetical protein